MVRLLLAVALGFCVLVLPAPSTAVADPDLCPPSCDRIPSAAWIDPARIPLYRVYDWPPPVGLAVTAARPRFRFEEICGTPAAIGDSRDYAVAAKAWAGSADGGWQLQVQVLHWRGETWRGGQSALGAFDSAIEALRACQKTAPQASPSITTDEPDRIAGVLSGPVILHQYLVAHPQSSTVTELAMWAPSPLQVAWLSIPDASVLDAMTTPLCTAYISSCG